MIVHPVQPYSMDSRGHNRQKNANGAYCIVETPSTLVMKVPHTPQGTTGFTTILASSKTLDKFLSDNPIFDN